MPDYPTRMSISMSMCLSPSCSQPPCYLQDRDEIADDVIITPPRNRYVRITAMSVHPLTAQSVITSLATVASIKALFRDIKTLTRLHFAFAHARAIDISHCQEQKFDFAQGNLPFPHYDATVGGVFMPDSTLEFLPTFGI